MRGINLAFGAACVAAVSFGSPVAAAIQIFPTPGAVQPSENVLANTDLTAGTVFGFTNQTNTSVSILSLNSELLSSTSSNGQARFNTADGTLDAARIFLTKGGTFTQAEFNLFNAQGSTNSVSISVNGGPAQVFALGNGQNFFGFSATGGDAITSISFDTNGTGVTDLRQVRLGGVLAAVPEPATWAMMLGGFGMLGAATRRQRRSVSALA
ncbi:PEPxxWA-CTERM sorting domain-containing protein [Sphingomonas tabacisoli]|uniref:PEPxxWA-CTERM sorting domain-containing protein n=1 Tax=Sphingomonas tabacisoli TaxID=2249466 RepID=A0ABW4I3W0_9SPHN